MLLLHPVPTSADAGPDLCTLCPDLCTCTLTFAPCAYGVSLLSTGATIPLAQVVVVTICNLHMVAQALQLALVVLFHPRTGANTGLTLGQLALCGGIYIYRMAGNFGGEVILADWRF